MGKVSHAVQRIHRLTHLFTVVGHGGRDTPMLRGRTGRRTPQAMPGRILASGSAYSHSVVMRGIISVTVQATTLEAYHLQGIALVSVTGRGRLSAGGFAGLTSGC